MAPSWGRHQFDYANTPFGWAFTVLCMLLTDGHARLAEDLGTEFVRADKHWNRHSQLNKTVNWLKSLPEPLGIVVARAVRRAGVAGYYGHEIGGDRVQSRSLGPTGP